MVIQSEALIMVIQSEALIQEPLGLFDEAIADHVANDHVGIFNTAHMMIFDMNVELRQVGQFAAFPSR